MNIDSRKISIAKKVLSLNNEKILQIVEDLLNELETTHSQSTIKPMALKQFKDEIRLAIVDEKAGRLVKATDLVKQIDKWD